MEYVIQQVGGAGDVGATNVSQGYDQPLRFLDQVDLRPEQCKMVLSDNAARLLKI